MLTSSTDTIYARASGAGKAGVAVYRLSGPQSHSIVSQLVGKQIKIRSADYVKIRVPDSGDEIDSGLAILFKGPASFTGEDVAELHLHGSRAVELSLYETLSAMGARPAEAGEFTYRALRAGKLDLAQVEALADLIDSETTHQRMQALGQLGGRLSEAATSWRARLLAVMAPLEADIDFPDEDGVPAAVAARAGPAIDQLKDELTTFLADSGRARMIREGFDIAIIGPPNAGKSSLLNALSGLEVAIVSDTPGTTRDVIETRLNLNGMLASLADTAGLRAQTDDKIEAEGMARARARAQAADMRILVLDPAADLAPALTELLRKGDFLVWSKADLGQALPSIKPPEGVQAIEISSKTGSGIETLLSDLTNVVAAQAAPDGPALTRARHVKAVEEAIDALTRARDNIEHAPELSAEDARMAARALGSITGAVGVEDVLGEIFSSFCIGK